MALDHEAIYKSHPTVVSVDDGAGAFDKDGKSVTLDQSKIDNARTEINKGLAILYTNVKGQVKLNYRYNIFTSGSTIRHAVLGQCK